MIAISGFGGWWLYQQMQRELPVERRADKFEKTPAEKAVSGLGWTLGQSYVPAPEKCDRNEGVNRKPGLQCEEATGVTLHVTRKSHLVFMIQKAVLEPHVGEELAKLRAAYGQEPKEYVDAEENTKRIVFSLPEAAAMLMCHFDDPENPKDCHDWFLIFVSDPLLERAKDEFHEVEREAAAAEIRATASPSPR